jgi:hypothetical protein
MEEFLLTLKTTNMKILTISHHQKSIFGCLRVKFFC